VYINHDEYVGTYTALLVHHFLIIKLVELYSSKCTQILLMAAVSLTAYHRYSKVKQTHYKNSPEKSMYKRISSKIRKILLKNTFMLHLYYLIYFYAYPTMKSVN
jgi:hypothetical protein